MITSVTLTDPARNLTMPLYPATGIYVQTIDVAATVREVSEDRPDADGSVDRTSRLGPAAVTVELVLAQTFRAYLDQLAAYHAPFARPYLVVSDNEWLSDRRIQLRADPGSKPIHAPDYPNAIPLQLQWKAPAGVWEDTAPVTYEIAADVPDVTGFGFTSAAGARSTSAAGFAFSPSSAQSATLIPVLGTARPQWTARLYGPATGPKLSRDDLGVSVAFTDSLVVPAGQYVEITSGKTASYLSQPDASRLGFVDFPNTTWFDLDPLATIQVRYHASSGTGPTSVAELTYTPVWIP